MKTGLIGEKLGHSFSKQIHEQLRPFNYDLIALRETAFHEFMSQKDFDVVNVTIPYKEKVIPYCDEVDDIALSIGAVNAIRNDFGKLTATNTDYAGLKYMIEKHFDLSNKIVAICGTGGTSKTAMAVVQSLNARQIFQVGRNKQAPVLSYEQMKQHKEIEFIINTTSVGMYPNNDEQIVDLHDFPNCQGVIDVIYNPLTTALCVQASLLNIPYVNGLEMLAAQAVKASEFFYQDSLNENLIDEITQSLKKEMQNIVLIGMPSCGKSTLGKMLAEDLHKTFVDLDEQIVLKANKSIPRIFEEEGEEAFRQLEKEVCAEAARKHHQVIACGGGIIKNDCNIQRLKQNGLIIYIQRDVSQLLVGEGRPLSTSKERLAEMEKERHPLYLKASDIQVSNHADLTECFNQIKEKYNENHGN